MSVEYLELSLSGTLIEVAVLAMMRRMEYPEVVRYYRDARVKREILDYCKNRWIAAAGPHAFVRYWANGAPLKLESDSDFERLFQEHKRARPRTIYASVNVYRKLETTDDLEKPENIILTSPIWDIDGTLEHWRDIVEVARVVVDFLEKEGVVKSVFIKWSGEGMHVHINERAFSEEVRRKVHPLNIAYSVVEYVIEKVKPKLRELERKLESGVKIENIIDAKRVFSVPLSLHKRVDLACVCLKPEDVDSFDVSWADPYNPKHSERWREYEEGEADSLALKAFAAIGGYPGWTGTGEKRATVELKAKPEERETAAVAGKLGRFQVMALLQAARYYVLTGDLEKAKSFGLNRAIFYAWAKHYGKGYQPRYPFRRPVAPVKTKIVETLGEKTPVSERGWFAMGGVEQRPEDFDRQVASRVSAVVPYDEAWKAAVEYVKSFPRNALTDPQKFFKKVYEPVRDEFVERVVKGKKGKTKTLLDFFG